MSLLFMCLHTNFTNQLSSSSNCSYVGWSNYCHSEFILPPRADIAILKSQKVLSDNWICSKLCGCVQGEIPISEIELLVKFCAVTHGKFKKLQKRTWQLQCVTCYSISDKTFHLEAFDEHHDHTSSCLCWRF